MLVEPQAFPACRDADTRRSQAFPRTATPRGLKQLVLEGYVALPYQGLAAMSCDEPSRCCAGAGRLTRIALVVLALAGLGVNAVLVQMSVASTSPLGRLGASLCAPGEQVDCGYVLASRWSKIAGVPVAQLGFAYCAVLGVWFVFVGIPNRAGRRWHVFPLILTTAGFCGSMGFIYVMASQLPVWCSWCLGAHAVNGLLFLLTVLAWRGIRSSGPGVRRAVADGSLPAAAPMEVARPSHVQAGVVLGGSAAMILVVYLYGLAYVSAVSLNTLEGRYLEVTNNVDYIAWRHSVEPVRDIPLRTDDAAVGRADAPTTLVVFTDFECYKCWEFHAESVRLVSQFPQTLRIVFRHFPVSARCNSHVGAGLHYFACEAAEAAEAARGIATDKQRLALADSLFRNRSRFDETPYRALAEQAGIDTEAFSTALAGTAARQRVADDIALAASLGVEGTPALFLNGRRLYNWRIVPDDLTGRLDPARTLALWERLLGETAVANRAPTAEAGD